MTMFLGMRFLRVIELHATGIGPGFYHEWLTPQQAVSHELLGNERSSPPTATRSVAGTRVAAAVRVRVDPRLPGRPRVVASENTG
jgi:hypothetical protein